MIKPYYETELGTLYHGDCLEILPQLTEKVDLVLTSPPYDNLRDYKGYFFDFEGIAQKLSNTLHDGGVLVWIVQDETIAGNESGTSFKQARSKKSPRKRRYAFKKKANKHKSLRTKV